MRKKVHFPYLRYTRMLKGYTQEDMTVLLEYRSKGRYAQYELGDRIPSVIEALRIADVLATTVEYLFSTLEGGEKIGDSSSDEWRSS